MTGLWIVLGISLVCSVVVVALCRVSGLCAAVEEAVEAMTQEIDG